MSSSRGAIAWMARNPVAANLLMFALIGGGLLSLNSMQKEYLPDTSDEAVTVHISYPGASPEEIESGVVMGLEEAIQALPGVREVWSISFPNRAFFRAILAGGADLHQLARDVQGAVDGIRSFPEAMEEPRVSVEPRRRSVLSLVIYGPADHLVLNDAANVVLDILRRTGEVSQLVVNGLPERQIHIDVSEAALRNVSMSLEDVASVVRKASLDLAAGGIKGPTGEELVRVQERREVATEFASIPLVSNELGGAVPLGSVATVRDGFEDTGRHALFNGQPAVLIDIYRIGEETPTGVADAVRGAMDDIRANLSGGLQVEIIKNAADEYDERVGLLLENGFLGLILVLIALGSLLNTRLAFWVMTGIPISFLGAILIAPWVGVSINMMSLFAFILALGIVVDDAIVVGENVYAHHERGATWLQAAIDGTREVARPVVFSIATNIVAFMPILLMPGQRGKLFWMIPAVVMAAFFVSLIEALFILPAHLGHMGERRGRVLSVVEKVRLALVTRLDRFVRRRYAPLLDRTLAVPQLAFVFAAAVLLVTAGYAMSGRLGYTSFPRVESDYAYGRVMLPFGTPVEETARIAERMMSVARAIGDRPENGGLLKGVFADIAHGGTHAAHLRVFLAPPKIRETIMSTIDFVAEWRRGVGEIPGVHSLRFAADQGGPGGGRHAMSLELSHRDHGVLKEAADYLLERLEEYPVITQISHDFQNGQPQYDVALNDVGRGLGLSAESLARQLRGRFYGLEVARQLRGYNEVTILVRGSEWERSNKHAFESALVKTPAGTFVPLREVATVERTRAFTKIERRNGNRVVDVDADITPRSKTNQMLAEVDRTLMPDMKTRFPGISKDLSGRQRDDREGMSSLLWSFPLALVVMFALLAIPFGSYRLAFLILGVTLPFGFLGAIVGHIIMGYPATVPGLLGVVALVGVLVNDAIVLVHFAEQARLRGTPRLEAVRSAAIKRFRPVFLTTLTTCAGLAPMLLETSRQAKFLIPMAVSLVFGLLVATAAVLLLLPGAYVLLAPGSKSTSPAAKEEPIADTA